MGSRTTKIPTNGRPSSTERRGPFVLRSEQCNADNCYRALFPCSTSSAVAEALRYCATVSAKSATNYPSKAIAACGTKIDRYISACSCPAANCQLGTKSGTKSQVTTPRAQSVVTTTTGKKETPAEYPVTVVTPHHAASTDYGAVLTKTPNDGPGGSGSKPSVESANKPLQVESTGTELLGVENMSLDRLEGCFSQQPVSQSRGPPGRLPVATILTLHINTATSNAARTITRGTVVVTAPLPTRGGHHNHTDDAIDNILPNDDLAARTRRHTNTGEQTRRTQRRCSDRNSNRRDTHRITDRRCCILLSKAAGSTPEHSPPDTNSLPRRQASGIRRKRGGAPGRA
ncbi:hypothetical protein NUW58_g10009 [Xylaria curta]|uniref:Uncharacterized protein n=1 Tax=Xylaria curta TaxID=42375 RepID=A0ACC1MRB1_9PEZI|nr:hypothetical protein NUW58_g10009 [Xylaria curta]